MTRETSLVTTQWVEEHAHDDSVVLIEVDEDTSAYDKGHIAGAIKLDWTTDLQDQVRRDFVNKRQFEELLSERGISNDDTVVLYGGNNNWFAAYAYWYFTLYGHADVKLMDGGRKKWELDSRPRTDEVPSRERTSYTAQEQDFKSDEDLKALYAEVGIDDSKDTIALCRIGERSSLTWFVLKELLGHQSVKNYDGSWTEYGSLVGVPIALGDEPGTAEDA